MERILDISFYLTIRKFLHIKLSFYKEWFGKGIIRVHTSLKDWYLSLVQWIHHNVQFKIQYSQVVSAIPRRLVGKEKQTWALNLGIHQMTLLFRYRLQKRLIQELKCKYFCWFFFINKVNPDLKPTKKWAHDLQLNGVELTGYLKTLTNFTFLHRNIVARN